MSLAIPNINLRISAHRHKVNNKVKNKVSFKMSTFTGFSEEDLQRIKSTETRPNNEQVLYGEGPRWINPPKTAFASKNKQFQLRNITLRNNVADDSFDEMQFEKCRLSIRNPTTTNNNNSTNNNNGEMLSNQNDNVTIIKPNEEESESSEPEQNEIEEAFTNGVRKDSLEVIPDIVRGVDLTEDDLASHRARLEELQLKQKLMEEQNKKRKEMLAKALADRTRQTEEEVLKLEKIKKELQVLDGQFSQDVNVLRKKIDQACLTYSEAEKNYLKVEKEFLQAKIQLQKEKEKKELLTEHLCALITHNETRKAHKLETLMLELASNKKLDVNEQQKPKDEEKDETPVIVDGVDERTGKMVEINTET